LQLRSDLDLITHLDRLGYDEAWVGEHHSGSYEIIGSPEVFIAAAAERSSRIRLGTGVSSLSYHHPLVLADRMCQLDHQTMGRAMLGVGPGQLPTDAEMMGIDPMDQRQRMQDSLDAMVRLFNGETVSMTTDWFELREARLQLLPFQRPSLEIAVASSISPTGSLAAGRHGLGLLSVAASVPVGFDTLTTNWEILEQTAAQNGKSVGRDQWRVVVPLHLAPTREEAEADVCWGAHKFVRYMSAVSGRELPFGASGQAAVERWRGEGFGVLGSATIGTPDDAIARIESMVSRTGGFGTFLLLAHNCADRAATLRSYDLFARFVMPHFQRSNAGRHGSYEWTKVNGRRLSGRVNEAVKQAIDDQRAASATPVD
jgi:limonene 1,2-monooxygenase